MRKGLYYAGLTLLLCLMWVVLTERLTLVNVLSGLALGALALLVADQLFQFDYYAYIQRIKPSVFIRYVPYLAIQVFASGMQTIGRVVSGRMNVGIVDIETTLADDFEITVLANSITLTPGTVTVSRQANRLKILWIDCVSRDPAVAGPIIKKRLEALLDSPLRTDGRKDR